MKVKILVGNRERTITIHYEERFSKISKEELNLIALDYYRKGYYFIL